MPSLPPPTTHSDPKRSMFAECKLFAVHWLRLTWRDLICMAVLGGLVFGIYELPVPVTRTFPITFKESGDIIYPQWAYPDRGWIIPSWLSGLISIALPILIYIVAQWRIKSAWDLSNAILGTVWSVELATLAQVVIKQLIGGFRPYFLAVCMPDISRAGNPKYDKSGLNGVGFEQVMYTTEICTQPDPRKLKNAITSFPSGHSTAAFAGFVFLFLWLNAKLKVWADHRPAFWKLGLTILPLLGAMMIACSLTIDAAHNWYDIVTGSAIGTIMAFAAYRASYASVWNWRFNHIPLLPKEAFDYDFKDGDVDYAAHTFTRSVGWGSKGKEWLRDDEDTADSRAAFSGGGSQEAASGSSSRSRGKARNVTAEDA